MRHTNGLAERPFSSASSYKRTLLPGVLMRFPQAPSQRFIHASTVAYHWTEFCGLSTHSLIQGHAVIAAPVHHQHGHAPVCHVIDGIEALHVLGLDPCGRIVLRLLETRDVSGVGHQSDVEYAVMIYQALPGFGPVPGDPRNHVAAVGSAQRTGSVTIQIAIVCKRVAPALLQIRERPIAPVADDGLAERLAIAARAMKIHHHDRIAHTGPDLRIPAIAPRIAE